MKDAPANAAQVAAGRVLQLLLACAIGLVVWSILCVTPEDDWNSARLLPAALVGAGQTIYFPREVGPAIGWIYGPVMPLLMCPVGWLPDLTAMMMGAALLNAAILIGPILLVVDEAAVRAGVPRESRRWRLIAAAAAAPCIPWMEGMFLYIQVDAVAVGLGLLSCWCLLRAEDRPRWAWSAAVFAVLAVWTKQIAVGLPLAQLLWLAASGRPRPAAAYLGRLLAAGVLITAAFVAVFGFAELWYNLFVIPSHHPLKGWAEAGRGAEAIGLNCLPFAIVLMTLRRRIAGRAQGVSLLVTVACVQLPLGVLAESKVGGDVNSFHSIYYFFAAAGWALGSLGPGRAGWQRGWSAALAAVLLVWGAVRTRAKDGWHLVPSPHLAACVEMAAPLRGEILFPRNPLITWWTERKVYHFEDGYFSQLLAGFPPSDERVWQWLPPRLSFIVYGDPRMDQPFARMLPGFERTISMPGFVVHVREKAPRPHPAEAGVR